MSSDEGARLVKLEEVQQKRVALCFFGDWRLPTCLGFSWLFRSFQVLFFRDAVFLKPCEPVSSHAVSLVDLSGFLLCEFFRCKLCGV